MVSRQTVLWVKAVVHVACCVPLLWLLWIYGSGALAAQDDPVQYVTHFTGHWALWLLLADLAITPVRRLWAPLAWVVRLRRMVGLWAFFYATLHLLVYVLLFSGYDMHAALAGVRAGHPGALWEQLRAIWPLLVDDAKTRRFVQVGLVAWAMLLVLAVTSPQRIMRAMGGRWWRRVHWLIYAVAWLALVHIWWQLKKGEAAPWKVTVVVWALLLARVVWWALQRWKAGRLRQA